jgi:hypothetical protein
MQLNLCSNITSTFLRHGVHKLLRLWVPKPNIVVAASPGEVPVRCDVPIVIDARALHEITLTAGIRDGVEHAWSRDGVHECCFPRILNVKQLATVSVVERVNDILGNALHYTGSKVAKFGKVSEANAIDIGGELVETDNLC